MGFTAAALRYSAAMPGPSPPRFRLRDRVGSFRYAIDGLRETVATQHNARVHLAATALVVVVAGALRVAAGGWALLAVAIGLVWAAELLNTAIEAAVDLASPERHPLAKTAKDAAAAAVLVASLAAAVVGGCVLGPPLGALLSD